MMLLVLHDLRLVHVQHGRRGMQHQQHHRRLRRNGGAAGRSRAGDLHRGRSPVQLHVPLLARLLPVAAAESGSDEVVRTGSIGDENVSGRAPRPGPCTDASPLATLPCPCFQSRQRHCTQSARKLPPRCTVSDNLPPKNSASMPPLAPDHSAGVRILARSFYKELRSSGYTPKHLLALSTELIELITLDLRKADAL